jgi:hypothetical protein
MARNGGFMNPKEDKQFVASVRSAISRAVAGLLDAMAHSEAHVFHLSGQTYADFQSERVRRDNAVKEWSTALDNLMWAWWETTRSNEPIKVRPRGLFPVTIHRRPIFSAHTPMFELRYAV